jgi:tRNA(Ile)-lysidine synthase
MLPSREAPLSLCVRRFLRRLQNTVEKFDLWQKGDAFIVGVSGGADSLCLLDVLYLLSQKHDFALHIAHVNYHLRGGASDLDEALVREAAERYHLPCSVLSKRQRSKTVSEEKLRDIRYAFFEKLRRETGARSIVIAHNQDDQAETLLLRLLRGAGLAGLAAMRPKNDAIIRPLIEMSRADIINYLRDRHIAFREDESNALPQYARNRIRHELIPFLEEKFQPQARKLLAETALILGDDYALLEKYPADFSPKQDALATEFSADALLKLPLPLLRRELRTMLRPMLAGKNPEKNLINELVKALKSGKNKTQTIVFKGLKFIRKGDTVRLLRF